MRAWNKSGSVFLILFIMVAGLILSGCSNKYRILLRNNRSIITESKPKRNEESKTFEFKVYNPETNAKENRSILIQKVQRIEPWDGKSHNPFQPQIQ